MSPFSRKPPCIEPGVWRVRGARARVLVEIPDGAELAAHASVLRDAGYDVAACAGPSLEDRDTGQERRMCPLVSGERCRLVDGADVVVSAMSLVDARDIVAAHAAGGRTLVVEGASNVLERDRELLGGATLVPEPVTAERLIAAVEQANASRRS
jgi:hypothetical protein